MSASFIGCKISLISKSEIRYEGILYTIDTKESTIALAKVRSFGTEDRVTDKPVAPRNEVYEYIIFRASDIKDLLVDDPPAPSPALSDPAIIQASGAGSPSVSSSSSLPPAAPAMTMQQKHQQSQQHVSAAAASAPISQKATTLSNVLASGAAPAPAQRRTQQQPAVGQTEEKTSNVQRQPQQHQQSHQQQDRRQQSGTGFRDGNVRGHQQQQYNQQQPQRRDGQQQQQGRNYGNQSGQQQQYQRRVQSDWPTGGQRRDGHGQGNRNQSQQQQSGLVQPRPRMLDVRKLEEYDFEKANAEFEELTKDVEDMKVTDAVKSESATAAADSTTDPDSETYNKQKSFFDSISCEAIERTKGNTNRVDRRVERKMNQETFGVSHVYNNRNWNYNRGGYRGGRGGGGGGNYQNRGFNQNRGYNNNGSGERNFGSNNSRNFGNNRGRGFHSNNRNMNRDHQQQPAAATADA